MDRIDAMKVFIAALDEGSLARAGRKLGRSPAAVSRAIALLEQRVGAELLHRTTRSIKLSEAGERYAAACRRVLADLDEAETIAAGDLAAPRGTLTLTAPLVSGEAVLRPLIDAFTDAYPSVTARLFLFDRPMNMIDEGIDIALRIGHLADSTLIAIRVGEVRRVLVAAPRYLALHKPITQPSDLATHKIIAFTDYGFESWNFPPAPGSPVPRIVHFTPRLIINGIRGAIASAVDARGITRALSYQVAAHVRQGALEILLPGDEPPPLPVHLIVPHGRLAIPKVRAFVDFAQPRLKNHYAGVERDIGKTRVAKNRVAKNKAPKNKAPKNKTAKNKAGGDVPSPPDPPSSV